MNKSNENFLIVQKDISQKEAYEILEGENDDIKPFALISIISVTTKGEADIFISHLTNHSGPVREAAALCLSDLINKENLPFFASENNLEKIYNAVSDINPNVCRAVIQMLSENYELLKLIKDKNVKQIKEDIENFKVFEREAGRFLENKTKDKKNHAKNRQLFNLYWRLELLYVSTEGKCADDETVKILYSASNFLDYTIREKAAKIISKIDNPPKELLQKLKNDKNFYVKNLVYDKIAKDR